jgi:TorA maturation chaperone TorD
MHFLCFREASADEDALSYQLAQADFSQRHLLKWVPKLTASVAATMPESLYSSVVRLLDEFLRRDFEWQKSTISAGDEADG